VFPSIEDEDFYPDPIGVDQALGLSVTSHVTNEAEIEASTEIAIEAELPPTPSLSRARIPTRATRTSYQTRSRSAALGASQSTDDERQHGEAGDGARANENAVKEERMKGVAEE
jgi:hypothetical protein